MKATETTDAVYYVYDYETTERIREATQAEADESREQAQRDGGAGVITVPDYAGSVYVA